MLIKQADDISRFLANLELVAAGSGLEARHATVELRNRKAGLRGERESGYLIDFDFAGSQNWAVIHDLRVEHGGRAAQIDHLLINRWLQVYVLETKHFHAGVKITDEGEFLRWNDFGKRFEGMASPLAQNERHIEVLRDVFTTIDLPTRAGFRIAPEFMTLVLVAPSARIDRPKKFDASRVIKADQLKKTIWRDIDSENVVFGLLKTAAKIISSETLRDVATALVRKHKPLAPSSGKASTTAAPAPAPAATPAQQPNAPTAAPKNPTHRRSPSSDPSSSAGPGTGPMCKACAKAEGEILYGKYGYYFKCTACDTNTAVRFTCATGHSPRLRKDGPRFYRECAECRSSELYHQNTGSSAR